MTRYLLDSNVFIQAQNFHYGFDFCPAFWEWLTAQNRNEKVASIKKVADELGKGKDKLATWTEEQRRRGFFLPADDVVTTRIKSVAAKVENQEYDQKEKANFLDGADSWLVAHAAAHEWTVVTHEMPVGPESKKIKIPNVCTDFGVPYTTPYERLKNEGAEFVLGPTRENAE